MNVMRRAKSVDMPEYYHSYNFAGDSPAELIAKTDKLIQDIQAEIGIKLIVIDGIGEYVNSVNNEEECNQIVRYFHDLAKKLGIGVILIIHKNLGLDQKSRGHLGSQLERKCETMLETTYPKDGLSTLASRFARNSAAFDPICFAYNPTLGYHVYVGRKSALVKEPSKKDKRITQDAQFLQELASREGRTIATKPFLQSIQEEFTVAERTAKNRIAEWKELGWIETIKGGGYRITIQEATQDA